MNLHGILNKGQGRRLFAVSAVAALGLAIGAAPSMATVGDIVGNVTFCHANSDTKDPYVVGITTDSAAIIGLTTGHSGHDGPVFDLDGGKTQEPWGDIIPAFKYVDSEGVTQTYAGLNIETFVGTDFLANECKLPEEPHTALLTLVKVVVNTGGGTAEVTDWTLDAVRTPEAMNPFAGGTTGVHQEVADGTYTLSELPAATTNYTASAWDCTNTAENGTTVVIGPSDKSVTCTITNKFVIVSVIDKEVTPAASATLGTCDAAGKVTLVTKTGYSWSENTGTATDPIYTATAAKGYVLTRSGKFTFHGLGRLPSDSAECVVAPAPVVAGVVKNAPVVAGVVKAAPVKAAPAPAVAPAVKTLAFTGAETVPLGLSGLLALVLGAVLTVASRRQRPKQARE